MRLPPLHTATSLAHPISPNNDVKVALHTVLKEEDSQAVEECSDKDGTWSDVRTRTVI